MLKHYFALSSLFLLAFCASAQSIIYVNHAASGPNSGTSWVNAYTDLQDALNQAISGDEIWVAQGTYYPSVDSSGQVQIYSQANTFRIKNGVRIYGGFIGLETSKNQRDWKAYETILSGEQSDPINDTDNSGQVVSAFGDFVTHARLDGFTIEKGIGGFIQWQYSGLFDGAALYCEGGTKLILINLKVRECFASTSIIYLEGDRERNITAGGSDIYIVNLRTEKSNTLRVGFGARIIATKRVNFHLYNSLIYSSIPSSNNSSIAGIYDPVGGS